jgi:hypothetical protein
MSIGSSCNAILYGIELVMDALLIVIVFVLSDLDTFGDKVGRVETNTELTNHGNIGT